MNRQQLVRMTRRMLAEAGNSQHDETLDVIPQVERSQRDLARQFSLFRSVTGAVLAPGTFHFTPPAGMTGMAAPPRLAGSNQSLQYRDPGRALVYDVGAYTAASQTSTPQTFYWGSDFALPVQGDVYLWPAVGPAALAVTLNVFMAPAALSGDTVEAWNGAEPDYHDLIAAHAAHQLYGASGANAAKNPVFLQRFQQRLDEFASYRAASQIDNPPFQITNGSKIDPRRNYGRMRGNI